MELVQPNFGGGNYETTKDVGLPNPSDSRHMYKLFRLCIKNDWPVVNRNTDGDEIFHDLLEALAASFLLEEDEEDTDDDEGETDYPPKPLV
ncbi:hypothetical protein PG993_009089 [Apiospora rasikravindrae]|uniref:Uncharacterized protein n=1 Tax=Apiospora rasikravindrae TaxID=990691 RepID=A0ABR1SID9_9PEZI